MSLDPPKKSLSGLDTFPPEVWLVIFTHARLPVPKVLSCPPRPELRQHELTVLSRTCKLFDAIIKPLLYKVIVTDDFATHLNKSHQPNLCDGLSLCENLYIECQDTGIASSYSRLLLLGGHCWDTIGPTKAKARQIQLRRCDDEVTDLLFSIEDALPSGLNAIFPRLKKISIGSVYGHQGKLWTRYTAWDSARLKAEADMEGGEEVDAEVSMLDECIRLWANILQRSDLSHLCIRDPTAPLGIRLDDEDVGAVTINKTVHFGSDTPGLRVSFGRNPTWVSDVPQSQPWSLVYSTMHEAFMGIRSGRLFMPEREDHSDVYDIDVYGSTNHIGKPNTYDFISLRQVTDGVPGSNAACLSVEKQREIAISIGNRFSGEAHYAYEDTVRWHPSHDYPGCACCGSGPPL